MQFHYTPPQTELEEMIGGYFCINAIGKIYSGDDQSFQLFLRSANPPPRCVVYIDSPGGDVDAAIGIGRLIRSSWFATDVGQYQLDLQRQNDIPLLHRKKVPGQCLSAATLMFLGGRLRYLDERSKFGVHQFDFPQVQGKEVPRNYLAHSQTLSARMFEYIVEMGISSQFLLLSAATPSDQMRIVSSDELNRIGVVTGGQTDVEWSIEGRSGLSYVKGERDSLHGHHKVMLGFNSEVGFVFWAVIETQNRARELLEFSLVEVVLNGESKRLDISSRVERKEEGIYTNLLARISDDEAKQIAFSESFGVQIRFSADASMFLGIAAMDTKEGREKLRTFFSNHKK